MRAGPAFGDPSQCVEVALVAPGPVMLCSLVTCNRASSATRASAGRAATGRSRSAPCLSCLSRTHQHARSKLARLRNAFANASHTTPTATMGPCCSTPRRAAPRTCPHPDLPRGLGAVWHGGTVGLTHRLRAVDAEHPSGLKGALMAAKSWTKR